MERNVFLGRLGSLLRVPWRCLWELLRYCTAKTTLNLTGTFCRVLLNLLSRLT